MYPHISYAITAWGSTYKSNLEKLQTKQNKVMRIMFLIIKITLFIISIYTTIVNSSFSIQLY
jgi:uncharacterized membrane protein